MNVLCILDAQASRDKLDKLAASLSGCRVALLAFSGGTDAADHLREALGPRATMLDAAGLMAAAIPVAREKFIRFTAEWPERFIHKGKNFKELFVHEGSLSLWWLTELSQKNNEDRPTFSYLCRIEAARLALSSDRYDRAVIVAKDRDLAKVMARACIHFGVSASVVGVDRFRFVGSIPWLLLARVKRCVRELARVAAVRCIRPSRGRPVRSGDNLVAFHTWYPAQWADWHGKPRDRYYVDLPDFLAAHNGSPIIYACTGQQSSLGRFIRALLTVRRREDRYVFHFLESSASFWEVLRGYVDLRVALRYIGLDLRNRAFRSSFDLDGVDIFPIARHDLRYSFLRDIPHYLLLARRVRGFVRRYRPSHLVTILETYCYGRAASWAVRTAGVGTKVVGYQHSAIDANQLFYRYIPAETRNGSDGESFVETMPIPDMLILHGSEAKRILLESGFPAGSLHVCGCPRFDDLARLRFQRLNGRGSARTELGLPADKKIVLVATAIWPEDSRLLIEACFEATAGHDGVILLFKPHPLHQDIQGDVQAAVRRHGKQDYLLSSQNLNRLQVVADVMVTANSTTGLEAAAIGCPLIRLNATGVFTTPSTDMAGLAYEVRTASELAMAIRGVLEQRFAPGLEWDALEGAFHKLDGKAKQRVADVFAADLARRSTSGTRCRLRAAQLEAVV